MAKQNAQATGLIANSGIEGDALLEVIGRGARTAGHLRIELPSSVEAIELQTSDLPHDSPNPLCPYCYELSGSGANMYEG